MKSSSADIPKCDRAVLCNECGRTFVVGNKSIPTRLHGSRIPAVGRDKRPQASIFSYLR